MNQTLQAYQHLKNTVSREEIGCTLINLQSATLSARSELSDRDELKNRLANWYNASGWYQTTDATALGMPEQISSLIEGEWHDGKATLSVRLLGPNQYQVTELSVLDEQENNEFCYQEQEIWLRDDLRTSSVNTVKYRHWFQQKDHAWQPVASQFIGFSFVKEQQ